MIPAVYPLVGLLMFLAVLAAICLRPYLKAFRLGWFAVAAIIATLYAGTKPGWHLWRFTFANGVTDNGSYCSNDVIMAVWNYNEGYASYAFRWAYRDLTITNEVGVCVDPYHQLPDGRVSDGVAAALVENATNMEVVCYAQYVQPVHVVTNGVYHVGGVMRTFDTTNSPAPKFVTPGVRIYVHDGTSDTVLTPTNEPPPAALGATMLQIDNQGEQE